MATRPGGETAQPPPKRPRHDGDQPDPEPAPAPARVQLNPADCNLDFDVGAGGLRGEALHGGGFAYCWSGARATAGVRGGGRYCFGCRVVAEQPVEMDDTEAGQRHLCRVGVSRGDDPVGGLGEAGGRSFGFGGTGKLSRRGKFFDYGARFGVGDTIVCAVDLDSKPMASIGFAKNGEWLGIAQYFDASQKGFGLVDAPVRPMQWESAIFPHVLLKNVVVEMQFSREDGLEPVDGYGPWTSSFVDGNAVFGPVFPEQKDCEVMMMVGLPASGKTTWAEKWVREHPEKRFVLLGTNLALDQMKVPGLLRKNNYGERFDRLMDHATQIFNTLLDRAAKIPRNYILDQTNVYKSARIRKLRPFTNYYKIAVVIFPSPSELNSRAAKRFQEMGKDVPAEAVDQMTANFVLPLSKDMPGSNEPFDEVIFVELSRDDAQRNLDEMKRLLPRASTPSHGNFSNQMVSSAYTGTVSAAGPSPSSGFEPQMNYTVSAAGPSPSSGFEPQMDYSYGQGVHAPGASAGYSNAPYQIQSSYSNAPYQQQTYASYQNPSYPNTAEQHQVHASYPSTYGSYPSTPLPGYGSQNAYGSQGYPSPYSSPDYSTNLYQTPEPAGDYVGSGYGPAAPVHAQPSGYVSAAPVHAQPSGYVSAVPVHAQPSGYVPAAPVHAQPLPKERHGGASSWSSGSYGPYGQQPLDARYANTSSQYGAAVPMPPPHGALLHPVPGPPPSAPPPPLYYMNAQPGRW